MELTLAELAIIAQWIQMAEEFQGGFPFEGEPGWVELRLKIERALEEAEQSNG